MTYSINIGENTETTSYQLTGDLSAPYFSDILSRLPDNIEGKINPVDIRDSVLSIWSSAIFKLTTSTGSNVSYIGIDTLNPDGNDLKGKKILFGKRGFQNNDVLTQDIIDNDYDILFYNTKRDTQQQITTRLSILSGTSNFQNAPYIQSQVIGLTSSVSFDFNTSGGLGVSSSTILINDFKLPVSETAVDGKVVSWSDSENSMVFDSLSSQLPSTIGTTSQSLDIFGSPTNINGFSLTFTDDRRCPIQFGDINFGDTFNNFNISDILGRIIYQYLPPFSTIRILPPFNTGFVEVGTIPDVVLEYSIFKRTLPTLGTALVNMIPNTYPPITTSGYSSVTATSSGFIPTPINTNGITFSVTVNDGQQSYTSSTSLKGVYPYYYGFSINNFINNNTLSQITKLIESKSDKDIIINPGEGFFYFLYDSSYGDISFILDDNNTPVPFDTYTQVFQTNLWTNKQFKIYRISNLVINTPVVYKFKY